MARGDGARAKSAAARRSSSRSQGSAGKPGTTPRRRPGPPVEEVEQASNRSVATGLGGLLRGGSSFVGSLSGLDAVRSLDRLADSAEHASSFLDRLEDEIGLERAAQIVGHLERISELLDGQGPAMDELRRVGHTMEEMLRSLREVEHRIVDLHERVAPPMDRMRLPRPLRRRRKHAEPGDPGAEDAGIDHGPERLRVRR